MTKLLPALESLLYARHVHGLFDDFDHFTAGERFALVTAVDGDATLLDEPGGVVAIASADATIGNEDAYLKSVAETFQFAAGKPLVFEASVQFNEAATNKANILVGLMDAVAADALQSNGGGPKASYSGAVFYKVANENVWRCQSSIGADKVTTATDKPAGGAAYQRLRIEFQPISASQGEARFLLNDELLAKHAIAFAGAAEMQLVLGVKDGASGAVETLRVDYAGCWQAR